MPHINISLVDLSYVHTTFFHNSINSSINGCIYTSMETSGDLCLDIKTHASPKGKVIKEDDHRPSVMLIKKIQMDRSHQ